MALGATLAFGGQAREVCGRRLAHDKLAGGELALDLSELLAAPAAGALVGLTPVLAGLTAHESPSLSSREARQ